MSRRRKPTPKVNPSERNVLVIGTGTIGEPLIGLLCSLEKELNIDNVLFHKRTPLKYEIAKVNSLVDKGAKLIVDKHSWDLFHEMGHKPHATMEETLAAADVIVDCTPAGNENKEKYYSRLPEKVATPQNPTSQRVYLAQGSEKGFGIPYAWGVNDNILEKRGRRFIQIVSCNSHAISRIMLAVCNNQTEYIKDSDFVCIRRANDSSQNNGFIPSPMCGKHDDDKFGTHHARDVNDLIKTVTGKDTQIYSSAMKVNSQYMHVIRFSILIDENLTKNEVVERFKKDKFVCTTFHDTTNKVYSFGRDHGYYGRIYNQAVVSLPSLAIKNVGVKTQVTGYAMTPQDGNSLLTSIAATIYGLDGNLKKSNILEKYLTAEV